MSALKLVKYERLLGAESLAPEAFREAAALVGAPNDHIVRVNDVGVLEEVPYLEMELLEGLTLDRLAGRLTLPEAQQVLLDMARGLAARHPGT